MANHVCDYQHPIFGAFWIGKTSDLSEIIEGICGAFIDDERFSDDSDVDLDDFLKELE